jgi:hypothetical protein
MSNKQNKIVKKLNDIFCMLEADSYTNASRMSIDI